jgi:hypothetical protein
MKRVLRNKTNKKRKHKKGCGCKKRVFSSKRKITGGNINPASFQSFQDHPDKYYYDVNSHNSDPIDPTNMISSRNIPNFTGGNKKHRQTRRKNKSKKILRGGNPMLPGASNNALTNFGNYDMAYSARSLVSGEPLPSTDVMDQPSYYTYSAYRSPLA